MREIEALPLKTKQATLIWESILRIVAFWVLLLLCISTLVATLSLIINATFNSLSALVLLDAYHLHFALNMGLGMLAFVVLIAWTTCRCCSLGIRGAVKELLGRQWILPLFFMVLWVSICTLINCTSLGAAFMGDEDRLEGILSMFCYAGFVLCALIIADPKRKRALLLAFWLISNIMGVLYLVQIAGIGVLANLNTTTFCAIFGQMNHHGYYVALGIMVSAGLFVYEKHPAMKVSAGLTVVLLTVCLIINTSLGSFIAAAFALAFLAVIALVRDGRGKLLGVIPLALFLVVSLGNVAGLDYRAGMASIGQVLTGQEQAAVPENEAGSSAGTSSTTGSNFATLGQDIGKILSGSDDVATAGTGRMGLYTHSIQLISESPVLGYGMEYGGIKLAERIGSAGEDRAHNEILQWGLYGGVPAMLLYVVGLAMLAVRQLRRLRQLDEITIIAIACCAEYLCSSLFGVVMITTAPYFWMFVGFAACLPAEEGTAGDARAERTEGDALPAERESPAESAQSLASSSSSSL